MSEKMLVFEAEKNSFELPEKEMNNRFFEL